MKRRYILLPLFFILSYSCQSPIREHQTTLAEEIENSIRNGLLAHWYPRAIDTLYNGYITTFTYDWKPEGEQQKMIVTQARHLWSSSKASVLYPDEKQYLKNAEIGYKFLSEKMWDHEFGGFYTLVERDGTPINLEKTAYGNSFGIYALAAYYAASGDINALELAKKAFLWLENHSYDHEKQGYFQSLTREGTPRTRTKDTPIKTELGYKDQNSSIHLLEAFTELYQVWPDPLLRERLEEMLYLIRDRITTPEGYLTLFFYPDWTPVSFKDSSEAYILENHHFDHVSFGHDVETAFLMLETSHVLGFENDSLTLKVAKRMVDHALKNGWDAESGGFYDEGYYFKGKPGLTVTHDTKNWWAQAEGLNTLLLMSKLFPDDEMNYNEKFLKMWNYINNYLIDHEYGEWYSGGLDKQPHKKTGLKGHQWKGNYHQLRALSNCVKMLREEH
jgi:cellobiose epimerase